MLSDFRRHKIEHHFRHQDSNGDGFVSQEDYDKYARRIAVMHGIAEETSAFKDMLAGFHNLWLGLAALVGVAPDARITLDVFIKAYDTWMSDREAVMASLEPILRAVMKLNGQAEADRMSRREWHLSMHTFDIGFVEADEVFDKLD